MAATATDIERLDDEILEAWNSHDFEKVAAYFTEDGILDDLTMDEPLRGRKAIKEFLEGFKAAFPDFQLSQQWRVIQGNRVIFEWALEATHMGPLAGNPPTGKKFRNRGVTMYTLQDGLIDLQVDYLDSAPLRKQLGVGV